MALINFALYRIPDPPSRWPESIAGLMMLCLIFSDAYPGYLSASEQWLFVFAERLSIATGLLMLFCSLRERISHRYCSSLFAIAVNSMLLVVLLRHSSVDSARLYAGAITAVNFGSVMQMQAYFWQLKNRPND